MKLSEENKIVDEIFGKEYLPFGITKVQMQIATADKTDGGVEFIEIFVVDEAGVEESARCWFTGGAVKISFNTIRTIIIHNTPEAERDAMSDKIAALPDTDALAALLNETCTGKELWFTKYYDPERTYVNKSGVTKKSINKNVHGYEPKLKPELMPSKEPEAPVSTDPANDVPFESGEAASTVPKSSDWS